MSIWTILLCKSYSEKWRKWLGLPDFNSVSTFLKDCIDHCAAIPFFIMKNMLDKWKELLVHGILGKPTYIVWNQWTFFQLLLQTFNKIMVLWLYHVMKFANIDANYKAVCLENENMKYVLRFLWMKIHCLSLSLSF